MPARFFPAPEVQSVADRLIPAHHYELNQSAARVEYLFTDTPPTVGGKQALGVCYRVSGRQAALFDKALGREESEFELSSDAFFCIVVWQAGWDNLSHAQREALVDHELSHAGAKQNEEGEWKLSIVPHDIEEFGAVVRRHGIWNHDLERFADSIEQAKLPGMDDKPAPLSPESLQNISTAVEDALRGRP